MFNKTKQTIVLAIFFVFIFGSGCANSIPTDASKKAPQNPEASEVKSQYKKNLAKLSKNVDGAGKADFLGVEPCELLQYDNGNYPSSRIGMSFGLEGAGQTAFIAEGNGGVEITTDLYHNEMTVSYYYGSALGLNGEIAAGELRTTFGVVLGLDEGVEQYHGVQYHAGAKVPGIPFIVDPFTASASAWTSWPEGISAENKVGPWGATIRVGVTTGVSEIVLGKDATPVLPEARVGNRVHWDQGIKKVNAALDSADDWAWSIDPQLETPSGKKCSAASSDKQCIMKFGEDGDGPVERANKTAKAICTVSGGCAAFPQALGAAATSILIGHLKKNDVTVKGYCSSE